MHPCFKTVRVTFSMVMTPTLTSLLFSKMLGRNKLAVPVKFYFVCRHGSCSLVELIEYCLQVIAPRSMGQAICLAFLDPEYVESLIGTFSRYFLKKKKQNKYGVISVINVIIGKTSNLFNL